MEGLRPQKITVLFIWFTPRKNRIFCYHVGLSSILGLKQNRLHQIKNKIMWGYLSLLTERSVMVLSWRSLVPVETIVFIDVTWKWFQFVIFLKCNKNKYERNFARLLSMYKTKKLRTKLCLRGISKDRLWWYGKAAASQISNHIYLIHSSENRFFLLSHWSELNI